MSDSIEDIIRRIMREELDAYHWRTPVHGDTPDTLHAGIYRGLPKSLFEPSRTPEDDIDDVLYASKPIVPRYDPPPTERRTGCACPTGITSAMCPHANCPWKPR